MLKVLPTHLAKVDEFRGIYAYVKLTEPQGQQLADAAAAQIRDYLDRFVKPIHEVVERNDVDMKSLQLASTKGALDMNDAVVKLDAYTDDLTSRMRADSDRDFALAKTLTIAALAGLLLCSVAYVCIHRAVLRPKNQIGDSRESLSCQHGFSRKD